jgi:hypothetical protein
MRIIAIKEETVSSASQNKNAYIDFSKMTVSALALVADVVRDSKPKGPSGTQAERLTLP